MRPGHKVPRKAPAEQRAYVRGYRFNEAGAQSTPEGLPNSAHPRKGDPRFNEAGAQSTPEGLRNE